MPDLASIGRRLGAPHSTFLAALLVAATVGVAGCGDDGDDVVIIPPSPSSQQADTDPAPGAGDAPTTPATTPSDPQNESDDPPLTPEEPAGPAPAGFNETSLLRPANLSRALSAARNVGQGGKPLSVRVEAGRVDLQLARANGALVIMQVSAAGGPRVISTVPGSAKGRPTLAWSALDPKAPQRLAQSTKSTAERGPSSTNYVVFLQQTGRWVLYRTSGKGFTGNASGRGGTSIPGT